MHMNKRMLSWSLPLAALLAPSASVFAQAAPPAYQLITTIPVPGTGLAGFDISWIDPASQRYYLADRTLTAGTGRIDVIDTQANTLLYTIPTTKSEIGFVGNVPTVTPGCSIG